MILRWISDNIGISVVLKRLKWLSHPQQRKEVKTVLGERKDCTREVLTVVNFLIEKSV
ncbi:MAG: hypothetical protein ACLTSL_05220 [Odoribacter splanchnicus]